MKPAAFYTALVLACHAFSCQPTAQPEGTSAAQPAAASRVSDSFKADSALRARLRLTTTKPKDRELTQIVRCTGIIEAPPQRVASLHAMAGGYIVSIRPYAGSYLKKGEVVAELEHPAYLDLQQDYLSVRADLDYQRKDAFRQRSLQAGNANAVKALEQAEAELQKKEASFAALEGRLRMLGFDPATISPEALLSRVQVRAPFSGFLSEIQTNLGQYVRPDQEICKIIDPSHLHLELRVFEQDISAVSAGQQVRFVPASSPAGEAIEARVALVGGLVDPLQRTVQVHCHLQGLRGRTLRPGEVAKAEIITERRLWKALPEEAVFSEGGLQFVILAMPGGIFERREVLIAHNDQGWVALVPGQEEIFDSEVVLSGLRGLRAIWDANAD